MLNDAVVPRLLLARLPRTNNPLPGLCDRSHYQVVDSMYAYVIRL